MKYNCVCMLSRVPLFATPRTVACQAPQSLGSARQEYWSGLSFPPPEDLPGPGIEPIPPVSTTLARGQVVWYSHLFKNFLQFVVIHTVKGFDIVNNADVDVFLELSLFP